MLKYRLGFCYLHSNNPTLLFPTCSDFIQPASPSMLRPPSYPLGHPWPPSPHSKAARKTSGSVFRWHPQPSWESHGLGICSTYSLLWCLSCLLFSWWPPRSHEQVADILSCPPQSTPPPPANSARLQGSLGVLQANWSSCPSCIHASLLFLACMPSTVFSYACLAWSWMLACCTPSLL